MMLRMMRVSRFVLFICTLVAAQSGGVIADDKVTGLPTVPSVPSYVAYGRWIFPGKDTDANFTFGHAPDRDISGVMVYAGGKNYFSALQESGRTFMSFGNEDSEYFTCRGEPGAAFEVFTLPFMDELKATGRVVPMTGPFFEGTMANEFTAKMDVIWADMVPFYDAVITVYTPQNAGTSGMPAILGFSVAGSMIGIDTKMWYFFESMEINPTDFPDYFSVPTRCKEGPLSPICKEGPVQKMSTYKNVPAATGIIDENSADLIGESVWLCIHGKQNNMSSIVTEFHVVANTTWGLYAQCNVKECMNPAPPTMTVGRECPGCNIPGKTGQCDPNTYLGSWYSWSSQTKCEPSMNPSSGACAWQDLGSSKSITTQCLDRLGFYDHCPHIPMPSPEAVMMRDKRTGFNSDNIDVIAQAKALASTAFASINNFNFDAKADLNGPFFENLAAGGSSSSPFGEAAKILGKAFALDVNNGGCPNINSE